MSIQKLEEHVSNSIRASHTILGVGHAMEELVLNSIESAADTIEISINLSSWFLCISDNGKGISHKELNRIGGCHGRNVLSDKFLPLFH